MRSPERTAERAAATRVEGPRAGRSAATLLASGLAAAVLLTGVLLASGPPAAARSGHRSRAAADAPSAGAPRTGVPGADVAGAFDHWVLSLSWSPTHCESSAGQHDAEQCGRSRRYGFVVHGLWPQRRRGYPERCESAEAGPDEATVRATLPLMPSRRLIEHEWAKHGTCSGSTATEYFALVREARGRITIPLPYVDPTRALRVLPSRLRSELVAANPALPGDAIAVLCDGRFLREVRICLDRQLAPRPCGAGVRDRCGSDPMIVRPIR